MSTGRRRILCGCVTVLVGLSICVPAGAWDNPKAKPPRAKPHRRTAAESLPPLPLPATPLRRSERKRPPAPPALVGMVNFSGSRFQIEGGEVRIINDDEIIATIIDPDDVKAIGG